MENALIIFVDNLEKGKVKKQLARDIGEDKSLEVYKYLLSHTKDVTVHCKYNLFVFYSHYLHIADVFDDHVFSKHLQEGEEISEKMMNAFKKVFDLGHKNVCLIQSDCYDLQPEILNEAFEKLHETNIVTGPSQSSGFYLFGMNNFYPEFFITDENYVLTVDQTQEIVNKLALTSSQLPRLSVINTMEDLLQTDILTKLKEENF